MTEEELTRLLTNSHEQGAEEPQRLYEDYGHQHIRALIESNHLAWVPTPLGELILLGSQGRRALGLSLFYKSPPEAAATQLLRRRVRERLEAQGWVYRGGIARNLSAFTTDEGKTAYVLARYGDYTARSVRRVLATNRSRLISESAVLVIATHHPHRLQKLVMRHQNLLTLLYLKK